MPGFADCRVVFWNAPAGCDGPGDVILRLGLELSSAVRGYLCYGDIASCDGSDDPSYTSVLPSGEFRMKVQVL